jgi:circadian clock protein KaiC
MVKFIFIPQPDILVDRDILRIQQEVESFGARRVVIDSISIFLHRIGDARIIRDKVFWLANIVANQNAVGFFINDTPPGTNQVTRFGVEETVVDGVISLKWESEGFERHRYIEVVKLRNTGHAKGRHSMSIGPGGVTIYPRIDEVPSLAPLAPRPHRERRSSTGVPQLDEVLDGGLLDGSVTLVSGSPGTGKSTLAMQFVLAAVRAKERALFISLEEGPEQLIEGAEKLGLPLGKAVKAGQVEILYLPREQMHATRFLSQVKDRLHELKPDRVVLDSASDIEILGLVSHELRLLLYSLVVRLRSMQVTSLFTLEARSLFLADVISERGLSPLADNIFMLRYVHEAGLLSPLLTVVKTRGSTLSRVTHRVTIGEGGLRLGERYEGEPSAVGDRPKKKRRRGLLGKRRK